MHKVRFKLDPIFFDGLLQRIERQRQDVNSLLGGSPMLGGVRRWMLGRPYPQTAIPPPEHLRELLETGFWASLQREERRSLHFVIAYDSTQSTSLRTMEFAKRPSSEERLPFDVRTVKQLAPAVDISDASIVVAPEPSGELKIWGVSVLTSAYLKVKALDPGQLILNCFGTNVAVISGDEAAYIRDPLLNRSRSLWSLLQSTTGDPNYSTFSDPRIDVVLNTVRAMRALAHGGTLIIVPNNDQWEKSVSHHYQGKNRLTFISEEIEYLKAEKKAVSSSEETYMLWNSLERSAKALAQLTTVDGATLVTPDLDVIEFGAHLESNTQIPNIFRIDPVEHNDWLSPTSLEELGHTRHESAARFVCGNKQAIAFVVSQDGHITILVWEEDKENPSRSALWAYKRMELTLF